MVFSRALSTNMSHKRSRPLHNFVLPSLKWANQRSLRCMKVDSDGNAVSSSLDRRSDDAGRSDEPGGSGGRDLNSVKRRKHAGAAAVVVPESSSAVKPKKKREDSEDDGGIENLREKLLLDLQTEAEKMRIVFVDEKSDKEEDESGVSGVGSAVKPWNLRTRRAALKAPAIEDGGGESVKADADDDNRKEGRAALKAPAILDGGGGSAKAADDSRKEGKQHLMINLNVTPKKAVKQLLFNLNVTPPKESPSPSPSPQKNEKSPPKSPLKSLRLKGLAEMAVVNQGVEKERRKFSISLGRDEIKEDLLMMTGNNPARRPKKRGRLVQKQLNTLFPGFWLSEVTVDSYRVDDEVEVFEPKKKYHNTRSAAAAEPEPES